MYSLTKEEFFANFKVLRKIGEGGCGSVFKIMSKNGEFFALKSIVCQNLDYLSAAMHEILVISSLKTEAVVRIFSYFMDKKPEKIVREAYILGIIMELAEFSLFDDFSQRKTLQRLYSKDAVYKILEVFVGLFSQLQEKNIAHRDIKPENILLTREGLKLTDFGLAKNTGKGEIRSNTYAGSPYYVSPLLREAVKNKEKLARLDHDVYKSDVFSLGLILLEAASLCDIRGLNSFENRGKVEEIINKLAKDYDPWFINVLKKMLEFDEEKRPNFLELQFFVKKEEDLRYIYNPFTNINHAKTSYHNVHAYIQETEEKFEENSALQAKIKNEKREKTQTQESESFLVKKHNNSTYLQDKLMSNSKNTDIRGKEAAFFEELLLKTHKKQEKKKIFFEDQTHTQKIFAEKAQPILLQEHKLITPQESDKISHIIAVLRLQHHENQYFITSGEESFDVFLIEHSYPSKFFHSVQRQRDPKIRINVLDKFQVYTQEETGALLHSFVFAGTSCAKILVFKLGAQKTFSKQLEYHTPHKKAITALSYSSNHKLLAVGSSDFCVRLLAICFENTEKNPNFLQLSQTIHVFSGHCGVITSVFFCEDQIISSSADSSVFVWNFAKKTSEKVLIWDCDWISCMRVCESKGKYKAFCGSGNKGVAVFQIDSGEMDPDYEYFNEIFTEWISFIDYSEEFDILIVCEGKGKIVLINADHRRKILNFEDGESDISGALLVRNVKNPGFILIVTHFDGKIKYLQISEFPISE